MLGSLFANCSRAAYRMKELIKYSYTHMVNGRGKKVMKRILKICWAHIVQRVQAAKVECSIHYRSTQKVSNNSSYEEQKKIWIVHFVCYVFLVWQDFFPLLWFSYFLSPSISIFNVDENNCPKRTKRNA